MKKCPECKNPVSDESNFCPVCGFAFQKAEEAEVITDTSFTTEKEDVIVIGAAKKKKASKGSNKKKYARRISEDEPKSPGRIIVSLFLVVTFIVLGAFGVLVYKDVSDSGNFSEGEIKNGVYINKWAGFKIELSDGWSVTGNDSKPLQEMIKGFGLSLFGGVLKGAELDYAVTDTSFSAKSPEGVSVSIKYDKKQNFNENFGYPYETEITSQGALKDITNQDDSLIGEAAIGEHTFSTCTLNLVVTSISISTFVKGDYVIVITMTGKEDNFTQTLERFERTGFMIF